MKGHCAICRKLFVGREGKKFCSIACKSTYHKRLRKVNNKATILIDKILHRNRSILLEIMGKHKSKIKVPRSALDKKRFNYKYFTSRTVNSQNKEYFHLYDFAYMEFSNEEVLIVRKKTNL